MKILVTGGSGFIGYHLVQKLRQLGHEVISFDNGMCKCPAPNNDFVYGDVRYIESLRPHIKWCDKVFHLAAQISVDKSIINPQETIDINVTGTQNVLELCRQYNKKMIFASTSEVYGSSQTDDMDEFHPLDCQSPYGASKVAADRLCYSYYKTYGLDVRILRNFNTTGPYQNQYAAVIAIFIDKALKNEPLEIFGNGLQRRDYMWVGDAVDAYLTVSEKCYPGIVINAGSGETIKVIDIANMVRRKTNSKSGIVHVAPRKGEVERLCCDSSYLRKFGWKPTLSIDEIIDRMILVRQNPPRPDGMYK